MEKIDVNGPNSHPVYQALKKATKSEKDDIAWNFETKFLISKDGETVVRLSKAFSPSKLTPFFDQAVQGGDMKSAL